MELGSTGEVVAGSPRLAAARARLAGAVARDFAAAEAAAACLAAVRPIHDFCAAWQPAAPSSDAAR